MSCYGKSTSGGSFRKLVDHMKQMELEVARDAAMEVVQPGKTIASHMFRMPHGASTVWHTVLNLTGMRGVTCPRSLASPQ